MDSGKYVRAKIDGTAMEPDGGIAALLDDAEKGKISDVLVLNKERLGADETTTEPVERKLREQGVRVQEIGTQQM